MKAYLTDRSHRPGCACCNTSQYHGWKGPHMSQNGRNAKRGGKKSMRQKLKKEMATEFA